MNMKMNKCPECGIYTLKDSCPKCGGNLKVIYPPKFSNYLNKLLQKQKAASMKQPLSSAYRQKKIKYRFCRKARRSWNPRAWASYNPSRKKFLPCRTNVERAWNLLCPCRNRPCACYRSACRLSALSWGDLCRR